MAPKAQKTAPGKSKVAEEQKEDALQAVIVADTFETRFAPFTLQTPRCLLPLAGTPLIEYTLEYLAHAGVQHVFLYAGAHADQVETYINASRWKRPTSPFKKVLFLRTLASSVGDVMRDLDQKHVITGDFIAVAGDVVGNFPIEHALKAHKRRRQSDKNAIMTMLLRETAKKHPANAGSIIPTFVIDPVKDRCLNYEEPLAGQSSHLTIDPEMLSEAELDIRQDLIDCRVDICTPEVLSLWSDNFDNQSPRKDFLYGVLKDHELNGKTVHTYIVRDHYVARAANLMTYITISHDLTRRRAFPVCPDHNLLPNQSFKLSDGEVYREDGVTLARSCHISPGSVIGKGSSVGDRSVIADSFIGRRCLIGKNVTISGAYVWDGATIEDNAKILQAIIADDAVVGKHCTVEQGALVSYGVRLTAGTSIPKGTRITKAPSPDGKQVPPSISLVGETGEGHEFYDEGEEENSSAQGLGLIYNMATLTGSTSSLSSEASDRSDTPSSFTGCRSESFATALSDDDGADRFHHEAVTSLFERMQTNTQPEDVRVELMGLRFGNNASEHQVRRAVAVAMMKHIQAVADSGATAIADAVKKTLTDYRILVSRSPGQDSAADQVDFLLQSQKDLIHRNDGDKILLLVAKDLYDLEIFSEEVFTDWWSDERSSGDEAMKKVRESASQFIDWLETAESESEDEDSDDE